jgi:hypothetical protein
MTKCWSLDEIAQIKAILAEYEAGYDWMASKLGLGQEPADLTYQDVFTVTDDDVFQYVQKHGWDKRFVREVDTLPNENQDSIGVLFLLPQSSKWEVVTREERGVVNIWGTFNDLSAARLFVVRLLVMRQWTYWNHAWVRKHWPVDSPRPVLRDVFPPPPNLAYDDLQ